MKLKLTLRRPGGSSVDVLAQLDATATVGDLATHLAGSDPEGTHGLHLGDGSVLTIAVNLGREPCAVSKPAGYCLYATSNQALADDTLAGFSTAVYLEPTA